MEDYEIDRQLSADASLSREEIVAGLLSDILAEGCAASIRRVARKRRLAIEFGAQQGWKLSQRSFGLLSLKRGSIHSLIRSDGDVIADQLPHEFFDHPYFYRLNRRAVAIAAHLYGFNRDALDAFAKANNLRWQAPDFPSWHYPGATTLVVFSRDGGDDSKVPPSHVIDI